MYRPIFRTVLTALPLIVAAFHSHAQQRLNLTVSTASPPTNATAYGSLEPVVEALKEKHADEYNVRWYPGGSLLSDAAILSGLASGIAQIGSITLTYFPAEFPTAQIVSELSMSMPNALVAAIASTELTMLHCELCQDEFRAAGVIYTGGHSTPPYNIISTRPVDSLSSLAGARVRVPGSLWSRWAKEVGATEVPVPFGEMYEGLSRGVIDATVGTTVYLKSMGLSDVAKYVTPLDLGYYYSMNTMAISASFWGQLSPEQRKQLLSYAAISVVNGTAAYLEEEKDALTNARNDGVQFMEVSEELESHRNDFVRRTLEDVAARSPEAATLTAKLSELVDKWDQLLGEVNYDKEEAMRLFREQVLDQINVETYGL